jgi:hypothetical protein
VQERWDHVFEGLGRSAPARRADEAGSDYRKRLCRVARRYIPASERIAKVRFDDTLPNSVLGEFERLMMEAVVRNISRTDNMKVGDLKPVFKTDPRNGYKVTEWHGPRSFVLDEQYGHRPGRRVLSFNRSAIEPIQTYRRSGWAG